MAKLDDHVLWFVWAGSGEMKTHRGRTALHPGVCIWMHPGGSYQATQNTGFPLGVTYIHFSTPQNQKRQLPDITRSSDPRFLDESTHKIVELSQPTPRNPEPPSLALRLLEVVMEEMVLENNKWESAPGLSAERMQVVHQIIAEMRQPGDHLPEVRKFAQRAGYSTDHFCKLFRGVAGSSPREFLIQHRIADARRLLADTNLKIEAIAQILGYQNPYFFSRQFRERTGQTPSSFRKVQAGQ